MKDDAEKQLIIPMNKGDIFLQFCTYENDEVCITPILILKFLLQMMSFVVHTNLRKSFSLHVKDNAERQLLILIIRDDFFLQYLVYLLL